MISFKAEQSLHTNLRRSKPLVSIIMPTFNRANYLPDAIESVLDQSYSNFEYLIVDDGSTDNTETVIKSYLKDKRIKIFCQDNKGSGPARSFGLKHCRGDFICFMDSDDIWICDKLASQLDLMRCNLQIDVLYGDIEFMDADSKPLPTPSIERYSGFITDKLLMDNFVTNITVMFRRKCYEELGGPDERLPRSDDYDLYLRYSLNYRFLYHKEVWARVRVLPNQLSSDKESRMEFNKDIVKRFIESNGDRLSMETRKLALHHLYVRSARVRAINGHYIKSLQDFFIGMSYCPGRITGIRGFLKAVILGR